MNINVKEIVTSNWILEDTSLYCQHDGDVTQEDIEIDYMRNGEHDTYKSSRTFCDDCGDELELI